MVSRFASTVFVDHDLAYVALAALVCVSGSFLSTRILCTFGSSDGGQRKYWAGLFAIIAGGTVWTTHFIAILGYRPDLLSGHDGRAVAQSLFLAIAAALASVAMTALRHRFAAEAGRHPPEWGERASGHVRAADSVTAATPARPAFCNRVGMGATFRPASGVRRGTGRPATAASRD